MMFGRIALVKLLRALGKIMVDSKGELDILTFLRT